MKKAYFTNHLAEVIKLYKNHGCLEYPPLITCLAVLSSITTVQLGACHLHACLYTFTTYLSTCKEDNIATYKFSIKVLSSQFT